MSMTRYILERAGRLLQVRVSWFQCLGQKVDRMSIVAHTLPIGSVVDGLLGIDFLGPLGVKLLLTEAAIEMS